ncbi:hypothetical protein F7230_03235 [Corynebacterium sp. 320]|uniref:hypothetical protein n=1 Tax=Corynebacterium TaxID=1716 RepID=UPI00125CC069|nr:MULTISPECIES: hypothetical protein [Corynebacterium]KAB1504120.1 hypothetical protein F7230_03235 [Corynebacterium sp. 320]KAB1552780.1 hypothetical protein F7233_03355 [Corynebacterium sp. 321]KAB1554002.1 hypothetical protein F7232_03230 [Corynebacterium sp. 319]KAB3528256.1 hypothetical protein F8354_03235 [Corynebacterium sp. 250]KAB3540255.1 hypothetical protein F8390_03100 [Corynebacterium sp. 366]
MSSDISQILQGQGSSQPGVIIDSWAYAQKVLLQGKPIPYDDPTALANHAQQAQRLLNSAVTILPLNAVRTWSMNNVDELKEAMGEKSRPGYAARVAATNEELRSRLDAIVSAFTTIVGGPILLQVSCPKALAYEADAIVGGGNEFDDDDAERVSMYLSDNLRSFAATGISGIIMDERKHSTTEEAYQPVINVAAHYDWVMGYRRGDSLDFPGIDVHLPVIESDVWVTDQPLPQDAPLALTTIPAEAVPETVLGKLKEFRA